MPGGGPEVTAPRGVREAPRCHTWLDPAPSVGSQHSSRPHLEDATSPGPPLPTPAGQMSPHPTPTVLHGYRTPAADSGQQAWVSPAGHSRSLRKPAPQVRVSSETQNLGSHAAGRAVAQLGLTWTQLSCREYFNVLSLLFKVPFCKGCLRL